MTGCIAPRLDLAYDYKFFGLLFRSNLQLPGIPPELRAPQKWDVALHLGLVPDAQKNKKPSGEELTYVSSDTNEQGEPALHIWKDKQNSSLRMAYDDGTQFWLDPRLDNVWATWPDHLPLENAAAYLLGPVLGLLMRLRGVTCLHASAVSIDGHAVAFVGPSGTGKSTTAAACAKMGYPVLSDDIVALERWADCFHAAAGHPQLRLWPESVKALYGGVGPLPKLNPLWDKLCLGPGDLGTHFENRALPLEAIYVLGDRRSDVGPHVEPLGQPEALLLLVAETYGNTVISRELRAREFEVVGQLVACVPVRRLVPHRDPHRLHDLCKTITDDLKKEAVTFW